MASEYQKIWEDVYGKRFMTLWSPPEGVVQFVGRFLRKRLTFDKYEEFFPAKRILDLGCGNGAVAKFLAQEGYEAYGIDLSGPAIKFAREWFNLEKITANLTQGDAAELPYENNFFDCVISYAVLDHMEPAAGEKAILQTHRVLRSGGLFFVTLADTRSSKFGQGKKVAHNTFLLEGDWYEAGAVQHYFDEDEIKKLFTDKFKVLDARLVMQKKMTPKFKDESWSYRWHLTLKKNS